MMRVRRSHERGHFDHGWLDTYHTFSFADYHDPRHMGFRALRVINEDRVAPAQGFGRHPHRDMEILTYVLAGELEHRDSLGNRGVIRPGQVQYMAAGTGVEHSEFNPSRESPVHLIQIWIRPDRNGRPPRYEQRDFPVAANGSAQTLLASRDGRERSIAWNQNAALIAASLPKGATATHELSPGRGAWIQVLRGAVELEGEPLAEGDGAAIEDQSELRVFATQAAQVLLFDLA